MTMPAFDLAQRFIGIKEVPGSKKHPLIQWWHSLCDGDLEQSDEIPWCSSFVNGIAWELRLPRSSSKAARSWLLIGEAIPLSRAQVRDDVVILKRGKAPQPGADVIAAPGHVGFFAGLDRAFVRVLGGNQGNSVSIALFPIEDVIGVRRLRAWVDGRP